MSQDISVQNRSWLDSPMLSRIRRNHGLEHATLHVLAQRFPGRPLAGHSNLRGFWILGDISTEELRAALDESLERLRNGEHELALHPNCGTNYVIAGVAAGVAGALAMLGKGDRLRDKLGRIPVAITLATLALIAAQPLGMTVQAKVTTSGEPGSLQVVDVIPSQNRGIKAHRVITEG